LQAVILAAGRGKRLHPVTATRTKAMAPICGKPIIERVMDSLLIGGVSDFILVTSPEDTEIQEYFRSQSKTAADVKLVPQTQPLGMGHALLQAAPHIQGDFVLSSCDNLVELPDIQEMLRTWNEEKPNAILTTLPVGPAEIVRMGIVALDGDWVTRIVEKPSLADAPSNIGSVPLYVFSKRLLTYMLEIRPSIRGEYELQDAVQMLIDRDGAVRSYQLSNRIDLTTTDDLLAINLLYLAKGDFQQERGGQVIGEGTRFIDPVCIEHDVIVGTHCIIGPQVFLEHGCEIGNEVTLENVVVLRNRKVPDRKVAKEQVIWCLS